MSVTKKEQELANKVIAEWRKKYPKAKLIKLKLAAIKEALDSGSGWDYVYDAFYEELAGEGARLAKKLLKGKFPAYQVENVAELVEEDLTDELATIKVTIS